MEVKRFFGSKLGNKIILTDREYVHCIKVTRHKAGYSLICCIGDGNDYHCTIEDISKDTVTCAIMDVVKNESETKQPLILCQALCKEFDFVVQKAVELGVTEIIPFVSERTNIKKFPTERAEAIILDAAKQCGRAVLPLFGEVVEFNDIITRFNNDKNKIFCYELEREHAIHNAIISNKLPTILFVGSEGGFTADEVELAKENGFNIVTLGKRILRVETAVVAAITLTLNAIGDIC